MFNAGFLSLEQVPVLSEGNNSLKLRVNIDQNSMI